MNQVEVAATSSAHGVTDRRRVGTDRRQTRNGWNNAERRDAPDRRNQPMTLAEAVAALPQAEVECASADLAASSAEAAWERASAEYEKAEAAWSEARARHMRARAGLTKVQSRLAALQPAADS